MRYCPCRPIGPPAGHNELIEETARHAGHADILREQIDGTVGE